MQTRFFRNPPVPRRDPDIFRKPARRKRPRMKEPVQRLRRVFPKDVMRRVTIVAYRRPPVARLHPARVLGLHNMAVRARRRIVGQVRPASRVGKGENPQPDRHPAQHTCKSLPVHRRFLV